MTFVDTGIPLISAFRGINSASNSYKRNDTTVINMADQKASTTTDKTGITVALEDFTKELRYNDVYSGRSGIHYGSLDATGFFGRLFTGILGKKAETIFEEKNVIKNLKDNKEIYRQDSIFAEETQKYGGIQYSKDGNDVIQSALNFAQADIDAMNKAFDIAHNEDYLREGVLNSRVMPTTMDDQHFPTDKYGNPIKSLGNNFLTSLDLDGNIYETSATEYAAYILTTDGLIDSEKDGLISKEEAKLAQTMNQEEFKNKVKETYSLLSYVTSNNTNTPEEK